MMRVSRLAVVRVRGSVDVRGEVRDTLRMLRLTRPNYCTIVDDIPSVRGMLDKVKEMVTWGTIKPEVLEKLLRRRGEIRGGGSVTDERIEEETSHDSVLGFAKAVCEGESELEDIEGLRGVFRLRPPKKGYKSTHRSFHEGGALGDRGEEINDLIQRMI